MLLQNTSAPVSIVGGSTGSNFSIAMNAKAFRVLSNTLYQDKIGSIVREISCNAYDAHVMAGEPNEPFVIHLPDAFEPWFSVQDFGVGLSEDQIKNVFTVYFSSTKDQSNDAIGAFGLGAKSPFSYTDQFTVTSVFNGVKTIYSAYIAENGIPAVVKMHHELTHLGNGVEIKMSVKREDFYSFKTAVENQLRFFKVRPIVQNVSVDFPKIPDMIIETENIRVSAVRGYGSRHFIVQGSVGYPLNHSVLSDKISDEAYSFLVALQGYEVHLMFDIGQIGVTASREAIEYDSRTCAFIESKILAAKKDCIDYANEKVQSLPSLYEKALYLNKASIIESISGIEVQGLVRNRGSYAFDISDIIYSKYKDANGNDKLTRVVDTVVHNAASLRSSGTSLNTITPGVYKAVVIADKHHAIRKRIRHLMQVKGYDCVLEIKPYTPVHQPSVAKVKQVLGDFNEVILASSIELPKNEANTEKRKYAGTPSFYLYEPSKGQKYDRGTVRTWTKIYEDADSFSDPYVYVTVEDASFGTKEQDMIRKLLSLKNHFTDIPTVVGIRTKDLSEFEDLENFVPIGTFLQDFAESIKEKFNYLESKIKKKNLADSVQWAIVNSIGYDSLDKIVKAAPESRLSRFIKISTYISKKLELNDQECAALNAVNLSEDDCYENHESIVNRVKDIANRLPLLKTVSAYGRYNSNITDEHIEEYIRKFVI